jgi:hypothetical protein
MRGEFQHKLILECLRKAIIRTDKYVYQGLQRLGNDNCNDDK